MKRATCVVGLAAALHAIALATPSVTFAQGKPAPPPTQSPPPPPAAPADLLARGQQLFEDQQYEEAIQALSAANLRPGNSKAQTLEIHRLLALSYITLGRKEEAENAVRSLLVQDPDYQLPASESPRFRDFFASVRKKWESEGRPGLKTEEAPLAPVTMKHSSPSQAEASSQIDLVAKVEDAKKRVAQVKIFFRAGSSGAFDEAEATLEGTAVRASIPPSAVKPPLVEYYFQAYDKTGAPVGSRGDAATPLRIAVPEPSKGWVLPVVLGSSLLAIGATFGILAAAGVFKSSPAAGGPGGGTNPPGNGLVNVTILE
jgi:hypothetical protein